MKGGGHSGVAEAMARQVEIMLDKGVSVAMGSKTSAAAPVPYSYALDERVLNRKQRRAAQARGRKAKR